MKMAAGIKLGQKFHVTSQTEGNRRTNNAWSQTLGQSLAGAITARHDDCARVVFDT